MIASGIRPSKRQYFAIEGASLSPLGLRGLSMSLRLGSFHDDLACLISNSCFTIGMIDLFIHKKDIS